MIGAIMFHPTEWTAAARRAPPPSAISRLYRLVALLSHLGAARAIPAYLRRSGDWKQARELFDDAKQFFDQIILEQSLKPRRFCVWPANRRQATMSRSTLMISDRKNWRRFISCAQQMQKPSGQIQPLSGPISSPENLSLSTPNSQLFRLPRRFPHLHSRRRRGGQGICAAHDDYSAIIAKALADRLAEAFAEYLHQQARICLGFGRNEIYRCRSSPRKVSRHSPAAGYPACPDHAKKLTCSICCKRT